MGTYELIRKQQQEWARARGIEVDSRGYVSNLSENLVGDLDEQTLAEFAGGAGSELKGKDGEPPKMQALHSSSALVCNVFDRWRHAPGLIAKALGIGGESVDRVSFEAQLPSGLPGKPPTLDLLLESSTSRAWGVEAKFCEPYSLKKNTEPFADSYFAVDEGRWKRLGLPKCQQMAEELREGTRSFRYLDAPQLLKHALGLRSKYEDGRLLLLWYRMETPEAGNLAAEIADFTRALDQGLGFRHVTYQEVFSRLEDEQGSAPEHADYFTYVRDRYFSVETC
ncbi:MAG: hypothetical protein Kow00129_15970 [Thermoleophilia bacterium]